MVPSQTTQFLIDFVTAVLVEVEVGVVVAAVVDVEPLLLVAMVVAVAVLPVLLVATVVAVAALPLLLVAVRADALVPIVLATVLADALVPMDAVVVVEVLPAVDREMVPLAVPEPGVAEAVDAVAATVLTVLVASEDVEPEAPVDSHPPRARENTDSAKMEREEFILHNDIGHLKISEDTLIIRLEEAYGTRFRLIKRAQIATDHRLRIHADFFARCLAQRMKSQRAFCDGSGISAVR